MLKGTTSLIFKYNRLILYIIFVSFLLIRFECFKVQDAYATNPDCDSLCSQRRAVDTKTTPTQLRCFEKCPKIIAEYAIREYRAISKDDKLYLIAKSKELDTIKDIFDLLENFSTDEDPFIRLESALSIAHFNTESLPQLITYIKNHKSFENSSALEAFILIGEDTKDILPHLKDLIKHSKILTQIKAAGAIIAIKQKDTVAIKLLADSLRSMDTDSAIEALFIVSFLGTKAEPFIPALLDLTNHRSHRVKYLAISCLENFIPENKSIMLHLVELLKNEDWLIREQLSKKLHLYGKYIVPLLIKNLNENDDEIKILSLRILGSIGHDSREAIPSIAPMLDNDLLLTPAAKALEYIGNDSIPYLVNALKNKKWQVRRLAIWTLGEIGINSPNTLRQINMLTSDENEKVRKMAIDTLKKVDGLTLRDH